MTDVAITNKPVNLFVAQIISQLFIGWKHQPIIFQTTFFAVGKFFSYLNILKFPQKFSNTS